MEYKSIRAIKAKTWRVSANEPCFGHGLKSIRAIIAKTWHVWAGDRCCGLHDLHVRTYHVSLHG